MVTLENNRRGNREALYVDPLVGMPLHVPARAVAEVGKQRTNAHLVLRRGIIVLRPAIFFLNRVVRLNGDGRKRIAVIGNLETDHKIVASVSQRRQ